MEIDPIEQGTGGPLLVFRNDSGRTLTGFLRVIEPATRTGMYTIEPVTDDVSQKGGQLSVFEQTGRSQWIERVVGQAIWHAGTSRALAQDVV